MDDGEFPMLILREDVAVHLLIGYVTFEARVCGFVCGVVCMVCGAWSY